MTEGKMIIKIHTKSGKCSLDEFNVRDIKLDDIIMLGLHITIDSNISCRGCLFTDDCGFMNLYDNGSELPGSNTLYKIDICNQTTQQKTNEFSIGGFKIK